MKAVTELAGWIILLRLEVCHEGDNDSDRKHVITCTLIVYLSCFLRDIIYHIIYVM